MAGFVYIMSNPAFADGRIKIGKSDRDPEEFRRNELNSTGVPEPFRVEYSAYVVNHHKLELAVHQYFDSQRPNKNREFFTCSIYDAITAIQKLASNSLKHEDNYYQEFERLKHHAAMKAEYEARQRQYEAELACLQLQKAELKKLAQRLNICSQEVSSRQAARREMLDYQAKQLLLEEIRAEKLSVLQIMESQNPNTRSTPTLSRTINSSRPNIIKLDYWINDIRSLANTIYISSMMFERQILIAHDEQQGTLVIRGINGWPNKFTVESSNGQCFGSFSILPKQLTSELTSNNIKFDVILLARKQAGSLHIHLLEAPSDSN